MRTLVLLAVLCAGATAAAAASPGHRYGFYRSMGDGGGAEGGTRRVFGGVTANVSQFPAVCALLDRYWSTRCTGAVVARAWVLTAAHCVTPRVVYVKYGTSSPLRSGQHADVLYLYRHPEYQVVEEDEGRGTDVTLLHNDVGLVRTRQDMQLSPAPPPVAALRLYNPQDLRHQDVQVLGFGRTEAHAQGDELFAVRLELVGCERVSWRHCVCGVTGKSGDGGRGVCTGDSGGPVLYRGVQVGVTSMGPMECATRAAPGEDATSVFTALYPYAALINDTIYDADLAMRRLPDVAASPAPPAAHRAHRALPALAALYLYCFKYLYIDVILYN